MVQIRMCAELFIDTIRAEKEPFVQKRFLFSLIGLLFEQTGRIGGIGFLIESVWERGGTETEWEKAPERRLQNENS